LTSHAGSLPRPEDLIVLSEQSAEGTSATRRSTTTASTGTQWG